jgi:hypothetical protein
MTPRIVSDWVNVLQLIVLKNDYNLTVILTGNETSGPPEAPLIHARKCHYLFLIIIINDIRRYLESTKCSINQNSHKIRIRRIKFII